MAKSVNMETTAATYDTEITKAGEFYDAMGTQEGYFNEGLSLIGDYTTTAGGLMGSWAADDVQTKFQDFITNDVTKTKEDISSNLSGGSFLSLKNTVNQVKNDLTECKDAKQKYDAALKAVDSAQKAYNDAQQATARASAENKEAAKDYESAKKTALDEANAAAKTAKSTLASKVNTTNTHFTELTQFVYNGAGPAGSNGGSTGGQNPAPPTTAEPEAEGPYQAYEGPNDPNGVLQQTTYEITDPSTGETITMTLLVNTETGSTAWGNDELGYFVSCISANGEIYSGMTDGKARDSGLDGAAGLLTDGHENHPDSSIFDTYSEATYGYDRTVNPIYSVSPSNDNGYVATLNVNGTNVNVCMPNSEHVLGPYAPTSLCDNGDSSNEGFGGAEGGGGQTRGGGVGRGRH